ncbi:A disintegrin and metalloproteinase with thrombospondin motifs 18-like [Palaemon carinicauda]|uniref:A disintegrin and metalloproteinase with thrombospondin motifs 18-like n=1 Tax=Palaemon carinicauda TaxID=392227 RepID=UPI0035B5E310
MILEFLSLGFLASVFGQTHGLQIQLRESQERLNPNVESFIFKNRPRPKSYQVLRGLPIGLHHRWKREANEGGFSDLPSDLPVSIPVNGDDLTLLLSKVNIADQDLKLRIHREEGYIEEFESDMDCFYAGNANNNWMVLSTCTGVNGVFHHNGIPYQLEQIDPSDQGALRHKRDFDEPIYVTYPLNSFMNFEPDGMESLTLPETMLRPVAPKFPADSSSPHETRGNSRQKRRIAKGPYIVELGVFVDSKLFSYVKERYPGNDKATQTKTMDIVMTLVNAVHLLYSDASLLDNKVSMVVKRVEVLGTRTLSSSKGDIYEYLTDFCSWQSDENPFGAKGHWDHALLLSGIDLWNDRPSKNSTVGLAYVGGMCQSSFSCTINEATTFAASYIIAHEMGHNFNMVHDGTGQAFKCSQNEYIMSPVMSSGATTWSSCSVNAISSFLKSNGDCLTSEYTSKIRTEGPRHEGSLPGKRYDADQQCHYMYGSGWKHFKSSRDAMFSNICREIWCRKGRQLRTPSASALQGTSCAPGKVCKSSKCIKTSKLQKKTKKKKEKKKNKVKKKKVTKKGKTDINKDVKKITDSDINAANKGTPKKVKKKNQEVKNGNNSGDKLSITHGESTNVKTKIKVKKVTKRRKPKKFRRIETDTHIIFKERLNFIPGKGWRIKTIKVRKTRRMIENEKKNGRKVKKSKKKKKKKKKVNKKNKSKGNNGINNIQNGKGPIIVAPPIAITPPEDCKPNKVRYVEGKGWWVKVPLRCVKYVTG